MKKEIVTKGLSAGSLFKVVLIGLGLSIGLLIILAGLLSIFGAETIEWNDKPVTGLSGFLLSLIMAPVFVGVFSSMIWLFLVVGNWLYTRVKTVTIRYRPVD